jgi:hypothetical protein
MEFRKPLVSAMLRAGIVLALGTNVNVVSQNISDIKKKERPSECEYIRHALDYTLLDAKSAPDSRVILVFYLGKTEFLRNLTLTRMSNVEKFLKTEVPTLEYFVVSEGKRRQGLGKVEIYIKGELRWELFFKKNASHCTE